MRDLQRGAQLHLLVVGVVAEQGELVVEEEEEDDQQQRHPHRGPTHAVYGVGPAEREHVGEGGPPVGGQEPDDEDEADGEEEEAGGAQQVGDRACDRLPSLAEEEGGADDDADDHSQQQAVRGPPFVRHEMRLVRVDR